MEKVNIVIAIDDLHPEKNYGLENDQSTKYLQELNEDYGCKFNLFIPSNWHGQFPVSEHKDWFKFWNDKDWIEISAHGHFHERSIFDPGFKACEFLELEDESAEHRLNQCLEEWAKLDYKPKGWRMPGWAATQSSFDFVFKNFEYAAMHENINADIQVPEDFKTFAFSSSITNQTQLYIRQDNEENYIYFQSHIYGIDNQNNWDEKNFEHFKNTLNVLQENVKEMNFTTYGQIS
jgi:hypothetical protein